ncbi:MAG: Phenylalanine--tRNA ligase beta subunit [bacterium ADurb.Bin429]|nr:MAG: Phenylalanine--tRNA ligase beta subunit [bacterium ADurb.Bin429]
MQLPEKAPERVEIVPLRNPKSEEYTHLRPTLFVSLLESLRNNARRNISDVQIFEIGRIFRNTGGGLRFDYAPRERRVDVDVRVQQAEMLPLEQRSVGIALMGRPWTARWGGGDTTVDFFWLKGLLAQFFADLGVLDVTYHPWLHPTLHPGRTAQVRAGDRVIGLFGELHPRVVESFDLPGRAYLAEINVDALMDVAGTERPAPALSRFPAVDRDIAFLVRDNQPARQVETVIQSAAGSTLEDLALFDVYKGTGIPEGQRSLAYRLTFRAEDRTLADDEVDAAMSNIRRALVDELSAVLR